MQMSEKDKYSF